MNFSVSFKQEQDDLLELIGAVQEKPEKEQIGIELDLNE